MLEERSGHSTDLPSIGTSRGSSYSGGFPGLLPDGDAEASAAATCSGIDPPRRARETRCDSNVGRVVPHHRWPPAGHAALPRAGPRAGPAAASAQVRPAATTASADHSCCLLRCFPPTPNVVETFGLPLLKAKGFPASDVPNCEGWVTIARSGRTGAGTLQQLWSGINLRHRFRLRGPRRNRMFSQWFCNKVSTIGERIFSGCEI